MKRKPAIIVPELKGSPILFTKNISDALKNLSVMGSSNLNINSKIATITILAIRKFFRVTDL